MNTTFECNITNKDIQSCINNDYIDIWGSAYVWNESENYGVEYNLCLEDGNNYSAIYFMIEENDGTMTTDTSMFKHYEIDFYDSDWQNKLKNTMIEVLKQFIEGRM